MLTKFAAEMDAECPLDVAVDFVVQAINSMDQVGQHSPFEHILGRGGSDVTRNILGMSEGGPAQLREERRLLARRDFVEVDHRARVDRAMRARSRAQREWKCGQVCFFWRMNKKKGRENRTGGWHGPALVLCQEKKATRAGARNISVVWITHGDHLVRCCPT